MADIRSFFPKQKASRAWTTNAQSASAPSASDNQPPPKFLQDDCFSNVSQEQSFISEHHCNHRRSKITNGAKSEQGDSRKRKADKEEDERKNPPAVQEEEKEEEDIEALEVKSACVLLQERLDREEESGKVIDLLNSPEDLDRKRKANEEEDETKKPPAVKASDNKKAKGPWKNNKKQKTKREKTKHHFLKTYPRMIFVTNKDNPNNPPKLANLPDSEFPIQLSDERVIDIFTD